MPLSPDSQLINFFKQTEILGERFSSGSNFKTHFSGIAYDGIPVCFSLGCSTDDESLETHFASAPQPYGKQIALLTHSPSIVLTDPTIELKENYPLVFYAREGSLPGSVNVWMSSRTHSLILESSYGVEFDSAIFVVNDDKNTPKFHLLPKPFLNEFSKRPLDKILMINPLEDLDKCIEGDQYHYNYGRDISEVSDFLRSVYSIRVLPALKMSTWPAEALSWTSRGKKWPRGNLVTDVMQQEVILLPCPKHNVWIYDFTIPEDFLLQNVEENSMKLLLDIQVLLYPMSDPNLEWHKLLRQTFLWFLEKGSNGDSCLSFLLLFKKFLSDKFLPKYFCDSVNVLDDIDHDHILEMLETVNAAISMPEEGRVAQINNYSHLNDNSRMPGLQTHLQWCFDHTVQLLILQNHQHLHSLSIDEALEAHKQLLTQPLPLCPEIENVIQLILKNSLGSLYMVKAGYESSKPCKQDLGIRAQDLLESSVGLDKSSCLVKLAMYHYHKKEYSVVIDLVNGFDTDKGTDEQPELWSKWKKGTYSLDVIISEHERPFLPSDFRSCYGLMTAQVLGYVVHPVATINSRFMAGYLKVMSLVALKKAKKSDFHDILEQMLHIADGEEEDMNEKRNVAYLNVLANIYQALEDDNATEGLLQKSVTLMANLRNPARWKLLKLRANKSRKMLTWGVACFMLSTIAAFAFKISRPNANGITYIP